MAPLVTVSWSSCERSASLPSGRLPGDDSLRGSDSEAEKVGGAERREWSERRRGERRGWGWALGVSGQLCLGNGGLGDL